LPDGAASAQVASPAIDIGLVSVPLVIGALTGDAEFAYGIASIARAIIVDIAFLSEATDGTNTAAAIDVALGSVLLVIIALIDDAGEAECIASVAHTISVELAFESDTAGGTYTAAAIDVGLVSVLLLIKACTGDAGVGHGVTSVARAIISDLAFLSDGAG
jgi:hypothetical protein